MRKGVFPAGFMPLPHPNHPEGGMLFPKFHIDEIKKQEGRDLARFDLDFDLPDHVLPEFPPPIFLTTRPDLGDVSKGKLVTIDNLFELFNGILNPKQIEGFRLLVTPFAATAIQPDRGPAKPKVASRRDLFRLPRERTHQWGHASGRRHSIAGVPASDRNAFSTRREYPTALRLATRVEKRRRLHRVRTARGVLRRRSCYRDEKGSKSTRSRQSSSLHGRVSGTDGFSACAETCRRRHPSPKRASEAEFRGQALFFGKAKCGTCHPAPYYTDNTMHNLRAERFYKPQLINGMMASADGPIKTFPLRGIKDSPPYMHDGRLLTLEDTVEFFNIILELV